MVQYNVVFVCKDYVIIFGAKSGHYCDCKDVSL